MLAAMACFVGNDVLMKLSTAFYPTGQTIALRNSIALVVTLVLISAFGQLADLKQLANWKVLARGLIEGLVAVTFISALSKLPLGNINAILQASSIIIVALAALLKIEKVGWRRWAAVLVGFVGVLMIVRPSVDGFNAYALLALLSAVLVAARDLLTRGIGRQISSATVTISTVILVGLAGLSLKAVEVWQPLVLPETLYLAAAAILVSAGNFAIIVAFRSGEISVISGFRYSILVFSILAGALIWGDFPDVPALLGSSLIVASGLYAMHRQRLAQRHENRDRPAPVSPLREPAP